LRPPIRVFLLAGNRLLREALERILQNRPDMALAGEAFDCGNAPSLHSDAAGDVLLMDSASMPSLTLELLGHMRRVCPDVHVLVIGMDETAAAFLEAVRAGATGYLLKDSSAIEVLAAIRAVSQGEAVCPPSLCMTLFQIAARAESPVPAIPVPTSRVPVTRSPMNLRSTPRQPAQVPLIAQGLTNNEIAARLNLMAQTIDNHMHRMSGKVGADERTKVVEITRMRDAAI
jgi:DNA-binding NarL/FixJ family response regulator